MNKKFKYLKNFIDITYFIAMLTICLLVTDKWFELETIEFLLRYLSLILIVYVLYYFSIIWHEVGHLLFGIKAKLRFISFNVLGFTITKENGNLKINKHSKIPGIEGYCNMFAEENEKYNKNKINLYFMGGIIFNFIAFIISIIFLGFINNEYLKLICIFNIITNIYLALCNSIPCVNKIGVNTDMLHIIYNSKDSNYIKVIAKIFKINQLLYSGCELKEMDSNLFYMPTKFQNHNDIIMSILYIDYISSKEQYKEAIEYIKLILQSAKDVLTESDVNMLKLQLLNNIFSGDYNLDIFLEYWDDSLKKYLNLMENFSLVHLGINYLCAKLIEKNEEKSAKILIKFEKMKKKIINKKEIEEAEKIIAEVNDKINKNN